MFTNDTVFVLGAGASWHYGYPTGEKLVEEVLDAADVVDKYIQLFSQYGQFTPEFIRHLGQSYPQAARDKAWTYARNLISTIKSRLKSANPLVIDYFLGHNPELSDVGRLLIAWVLHERENMTRYMGSNYNRGGAEAQDNWARFLVSRLSSGCVESSDLLKNRVSFITFNYDLSLERAIFGGFDGLSFFDRADVDEFISNGRIIHVYGHLYSAKLSNIDTLPFPTIRQVVAGQNIGSEVISILAELQRLFDVVWASAQKINVIDPTQKEDNAEALSSAKSIIRSARTIYVLGYGFDENNNRRIGLDKLYDPYGIRKNVAVMFTNFCESNRISKRAGNLFLNNHEAFLGRKTTGNPKQDGYFEMSEKNVYEALSLDFDDL